MKNIAEIVFAMKKNAGAYDRAIRIAISVLLVAVFFANPLLPPLTGVALLVIAWIFLLTGLTGVCPLYRALGLSTCRKKRVNNA